MIKKTEPHIEHIRRFVINVNFIEFITFIVNVIIVVWKDRCS